jgi:hypothetical protein
MSGNKPVLVTVIGYTQYMKTFYSDLSKKEFPISERISGKTLRHSIISPIQKDNP